MTDSQWEQVWQLVQSAETLAPNQWAAHLNEATSDSAIAEEALRILREGEAMQPSAPLPEAIGPYRILRVIAEGGMGIVYEAQQDQPRRTVALKVIKPGHMTAALRRRFEWEAEALGRLSHPGIAQIFAAGTADTSFGTQSYFAMEFVDGKPLTEFAAAHQLDLHGRLALLMRICDAVQHAHSQGIIHRDLKPSNILVTEAGEPRILDFGVARLVDSDVLATRHTSAGELLGTLAYMSPEQVSGDPQAVDTRSDIYSLGVILYELLADRLPYQILNQPIFEAAKVICEQEPLPLQLLPLNLKNHNFHTDVETILAKSLEKEKTRRYSSAAALAEDIGRYLHDEPIAARPASAIYKARKFARRHRGVVVGIAVAVLALLAGTAVSLFQAVRATRAEESALAVGNFLQNDLLAQASFNAQASANNRPDPDLKVRTALDRAAQRITGKFSAQPEVEASIRHTIGRTYLDLGLYQEALGQLLPADQLRNQALGPDAPATLESQFSLAELLWKQGKYQEATQKASRVLDLRKSLFGPKHPATLMAMHLLAAIARSSGKYTVAEQLYTEVVELRKQVLGAEHPDTLQSMHGLVDVYLYSDKSRQAQVLAAQVLEAGYAPWGPNIPTPSPPPRSSLSPTAGMATTKRRCRSTNKFSPGSNGCWATPIPPP